MHPGEVERPPTASRSLRVVRVIAVLLLCVAPVFAQNDLDQFMSQVLTRRDDNWKKLQQYVLNERESLKVTGPGGVPIFGMRNEYLWFPQDPSTGVGASGKFVRSPLSLNGVTVSEADRRKAEAVWLAREERRDKRRAEGKAATSAAVTIGPRGASVEIESAMREAFEPGFVSSAYFLRFKFEPGHYALVGREMYEGQEALRVEYYPAEMFKEGRTRPNKELRQKDAEIEQKMNKVSLVTLWVLPKEHQIVKYEFSNIDMDFLPARWFTRVEGLHAGMEMGQAFPGVWLPRRIEIGFEMSLATGEIDGRYVSEYYDYRLAEVKSRVR